MPTNTDMRVTKGKCQFAFHSEFYPHIHILRNPQIDLSHVTNQALVLEVWSPGNNNSKINNVFDPARKSTERSSIVSEKSLGVISDRCWRRQWHPTPVPLPGKSHGRKSLVGCSPWGCEEPDTTERLHFHFSLSCIGEGNGNPLQCSCLENPRDSGAWWAAVYGVAQSRTRLKRLSSSSSSSDRRIETNPERKTKNWASKFVQQGIYNQNVLTESAVNNKDRCRNNVIELSIN